MKEEKSFRAFACDTVPLWEMLHDLKIPVSSKINPDYMQGNSGLIPENIIIIIGRAPPADTSKAYRQGDSARRGNAAAPGFK